MRRHYEAARIVPALSERIFAYLDAHERLAAHMGKSSWMMGGGHMDMQTDDGQGQRVGSHIRLSGTAFGLPISLDEVVTRHDPPTVKEWQTAGEPRLLVIGAYKMGLRLKPTGQQSNLSIFIDYDLPTSNAWLGTLFGDMYARWCVRMMLDDAQKHFAPEQTRSAA